MKKTLRGRLTYANVIATLALFIALGGGAYAATQLPKNSVGPRQIKKGAVTPAKLNKASKRRLKGPRGAQGLQGPQGAAGPLLETLPSGKTERGAYGFASTRFEASTPGNAYEPGFETSYPIPLPFAPTINVIKIGGPATANCPGSVSSPTAAPGNLCVYEQREDATLSVENAPAEGRFGFLVFAVTAEGENYENHGTWAVTAP